MKLSITHLLAAAAVTLGTAIGVEAGAPGGGRGRGGAGARTASTQRTAEDSAEVTALKPAFMTLLGADHDYDGHRIKAMVAIAEACRMMGTDIVPPDLKERLEHAGGGRGATTGTGATSQNAPVKHATTEKHATSEPEAQTASDTQLKQAQTIVQQVRDGIGAGSQPRVAAKLDNAINEINLALAVK